MGKFEKRTVDIEKQRNSALENRRRCIQVIDNAQ
jgi:hypothetical protein